jgi:copper(I)-binding protein
MTPARSSRFAFGVAAALAVAVLSGSVLAACGDDDGGTTATSTTVAGALTIDGAWARTSPAIVSAGAVYLELTNASDVDDALVGVAVDATVAARAELHETKMSGSDGMMSMSPVDEIAVPAGVTVALEPGGYHVMLLDLTAALETGTTIEITLTFERAGTQVVEAEVRDVEP